MNKHNDNLQSDFVIFIRHHCKTPLLDLDKTLLYCSKVKTSSFVTDLGDIRLKFRFGSDLGDHLPPFFKGYCYQLIMSYFPLALILQSVSLTIAAGIICNMSILPLHFKFILIATLKLY